MPHMAVRTANIQVCAVCGQVFDVECREREGNEVALLGAARYAWCVSCGRQVLRPWSAEYRGRWDRWRQKRRDERRRREANRRPAEITAAAPFPWRLVNAQGVTLYLTITLCGPHFLVRWYRGDEVEAQDRCRDWDEAAARANELRERLLRLGYRDA